MEPQITLDEVLTELDKYAEDNHRRVFLTDEQVIFLKACREHEPPVSFKKMTELWQKLGWGKIAKASIQERWYKIQRGEIK